MFFNKCLIVLVLVNVLISIVLNVSAFDVNTTSGLVRGSTIQVLNQSVEVFLGIPFAEPPIGELRFRKPKPLKQPLNYIIDGTKPGNSCIQQIDPNLVFPNYPNTTNSENCLVLNIYSPNMKNSNRLKPVMFWILGGGLFVGTIDQYDGRFLATHDVVFVAPNYRLGAFGWLYGGSDSAPGNLGLYDQRLALLWVKDNIHRFGGDPNQITIFGESAGAWCVSAQILSPLARGLFNKAILESGSVFFNIKKDILNTTEALAQAEQAAAGVNCTDPNTFVDCLRQLDASVINTLPIRPLVIAGTEYVPISAQKAFKTNKYNRDIDILAGVMRNEGSFVVEFFLNFLGSPIPHDFVTVTEFKNLLTVLTNNVIFGLDVEQSTEFYLRNRNTSNTASMTTALRDLFGDVYLVCPTYLFAKLFAKSNPKRSVYFFEDTYAHLDPAPGCVPLTDGICHEAELAYVFGRPFLETNSLQIDIDFTVEVMKLWTNFAKFGRPTSETTLTAEWPQLLAHKSQNSRKVKELNPYNYDRIFDQPFKRTCDEFWTTFFF